MFKPASQLDTNKPEPGLYIGVPRSVYYQPWGCNHSTLKHIDESPLQCIWERQRPHQNTEATRWGTALHAWAFDRENFYNEVHVVDVTTHKAKQNYEAAHPEIGAAIDKEEHEEIKEASKNIGAHPDARRWRSLPGHKEVTIVWNDPSGVLCKARIDKMCANTTEALAAGELCAWNDVKSTKSIAPEDIERSIYEFDYHCQNAMYRRGLHVLGVPDLLDVMIFVKNKPTYGVVTHTLDDDTKRIADDIVNARLAEWAACEKTGNWPRRVADAPTPIGLPGWIKKRYQQEAIQ